MHYLIETILIAVVAYVFSLFLPWWSIALAAGLVAFLYNSKAASFWTGFIAVAVLWSILTFTLSAANGHLLANKMGQLLVPSGAVSGISMVFLTALIGGIVGGLGALTGKMGRKLLNTQ